MFAAMGEGHGADGADQLALIFVKMSAGFKLSIWSRLAISIRGEAA